MTKGLARGVSASVAVAALSLTAAIGAQAAPASYTSPTACTAPQQLTLLGFNDFHGRISSAKPDTVAFFGTIEAERAAAGEANSLVLSQGDNVGASLFTSAVQDDKPTVDMLNAMDLDATAIGNHEFDKGFKDLTGRLTSSSQFPYLAANLYKPGTKTPAFKAYQLFDKGGLKVAVVGAVTGDLKSLVAPEVFANVDLGDPVEGVNAVAKQLSDGDGANGEADVIIASYHEGAAVSDDQTLAAAKANAAFASIVDKTAPEVDAILNAHTHQSYSWSAPVPGTNRQRPVVQSGSYAALVGKTVLSVDTAAATRGTVCKFTAENLPVVASDQVPALAAKYPRVAEVQKLNQAALDQASVIGAKVIANSTAEITRGLKADGSPDNRAVESTMSDMVAQMFYDKLSAGDPNFIGVQNPGGTRADLPVGEISYEKAAAILPFANTLMTTQVTGAQLKTMLEQQWQTNADGTVPSRPYLQLGLSSNMTYTFDESRPAGDRITSMTVSGKPVDAKATYTIGSGSFLITGGDNFRVLAEGTNTRDTGASDLDAWVSWLQAKGTVKPDFARQAVQVKGSYTLQQTVPSTFVVGTPVAGGLQTDTLDMAVKDAVKNTSLVAMIDGTRVGSATVTDGKATIDVTVPKSIAPGRAILELRAAPSGTTVSKVSVLIQPDGFHTIYGSAPKATGLIGEATGDARADLWALNRNGDLMFYRHNGTGLNTVGKRGTGLEHISYLAAITDQNGDGRADLLYRDKTDGSLWFAWNMGNGYLAKGRQVGTNWAGMDQIFYAGKLSASSNAQYVLARRASDGTLWRYELTSKGLGEGVQAGHGWQGMRIITSPGDKFGDKAWDVIGIRADGLLFGYRAENGRLRDVGQIGHGWGAMQLAFTPGDVTGDGRLDLIAKRSDGTLWQYTNTARSYGPAKQIGKGFGPYVVMA